MPLEYLKWDSDFFKRKIGKLNCFESRLLIPDLYSLLQQAQSEDYELIYCLCNKEFSIESSLLDKYAGKLVDQKVVFEVDCRSYLCGCPDVEEYNSVKTDEQMIELAYQSGKYSRYRLDTRFSEADFKKLYRTWIENSVNKQIADKVFIVKDNNKLTGMLTLKIREGYGDIGLLAVNEGSRGKGIGKQLINAAKGFLVKQNISTLEVATQLNNTNACIFYEKCGFAEKSITNIYHFWIKKAI